jgi:hypothetical protein
MTPYTIGTILALAAAGTAVVVATLAVAAIWRRTEPRLSSVTPRSRAHLLAALRLLPAVAGVIFGAVTLIAFVRLEPADAQEVLGFTLPAAAFATLTAFVWRFTTAYRAWARTARAVAAWKAQHLFVDCDFPIVAVVGIWRPRLYVARRVVEACDREELDAMIAHEHAHVGARDNLTRFCFLCAPFAQPAVARALEMAWTRASEEAADDAARRDERTSLALASALTKVAACQRDLQRQQRGRARAPLVGNTAAGRSQTAAVALCDGNRDGGCRPLVRGGAATNLRRRRILRPLPAVNHGGPKGPPYMGRGAGLQARLLRSSFFRIRR